MRSEGVNHYGSFSSAGIWYPSYDWDADRRGFKAVPCASCGADVGEPCFMNGGRGDEDIALEPHAPRRRRAGG